MKEFRLVSRRTSFYDSFVKGFATTLGVAVLCGSGYGLLLTSHKAYMLIYHPHVEAAQEPVDDVDDAETEKHWQNTLRMIEQQSRVE